jgi:hypothetical protein
MAGSRPGPAPSRPEERNRRNIPASGAMEEFTAEQLASLPFDIETLVEPPPVNEDWHDVARMVYSAMLRDPARLWMGPAAWAIAYLMCENISREMKPQAIGIVEGGLDPETGDQVSGHVAHAVVPMKGTISKAIKFNGVEQPTHQPSEGDVSPDRDFFIVPGEKESS